MAKFALSQTAIKAWKDTPPNIWYKMYVTKELPRPQSNATKLGSYVHALILSPNEVDEKFVVYDKDQPSDSIIKVFKRYLQLIEDHNNQELKEGEELKSLPYDLTNTDLLKQVCVEVSYYKTQLDRAIKELSKETAYFEFLISTRCRTIITSAEVEDAKALKEILLSDNMSKGFFVPKKNCEVLFEVKIEHELELPMDFELDFIPTKGYIDILHFNHKREEVREVDLKITDDAFNFHTVMRIFDYPSQHSFYDMLIREFLKVYQDGKYAHYTVMNPLNVVIDNDIRIPYIYEYNQNDLYIKRYGIENTNVKGWQDTVHEIAWHLEKGDWSRPKYHIENKKLLVNIFKR
jgi:hypothetical protein